jgi:hypothetical protein
VFQSESFQVIEVQPGALSVPHAYPQVPAEFEIFGSALKALLESAREAPPLMVDRQEAARLCGMSVATFDKYAGRGFLPRMNATGRVSVEALKRACLKLDGIAVSDVVDDPADTELVEFRRANGYV